MNAVKHVKQLVSKNKRRFQEDGYDLDLSYVMNNVIAMGYPSESMESMYRNSLDDVKRFLEERHKDHYKVYNLCSERCYDIQKFHGRVSVYPFDDHAPPEFGQILPFCRDVQAWLGENEDNVAAIHCKAGKGRTGLMICAFLLFSGAFKSSKEVLSFYAGKRTFDSNGVTIPSQRRYVDYFSTKINRGLEYSPIRLMLEAIILEPPPHVGFGHHECHLQFSVIQHFHAPFQSEIYSTSWSDSKVVLKLASPLALSGDVKIAFTQKMSVDVFHLRNKPTKFISTVPHSKLFHFWVNTFFIDKNFSSELTHRITDRPPQDQEQTKLSRSRPIPRNHTYSKNLESFSRMANRFAPLSMPDLKADLSEEDLLTLASSGNSSGSGSEDSGLHGDDDAASSSCRFYVRLSKKQIDKASKDNSDRFPEKFSVTLLMSRPGQEEPPQENGACGGGLERGRL